jgi:hypothetical protein
MTRSLLAFGFTKGDEVILSKTKPEALGGSFFKVGLIFNTVVCEWRPDLLSTSAGSSVPLRN